MTHLAGLLLWIDDARRDCRYAARLWIRSPLIALTATASLAIGIGATTAVYAVAAALLFQDPPGVAAPRDLVDIGTTRHGSGFGPGSYLDYLDVARGTTLQRAYACSRFPVAMSVRTADRTDGAFASLVTGAYFTALGATPAIGRLFESADSEGAGATAVVVLSHGFWTRRFSRDPGIVGRTIWLNGQPFTVIGVAAEGFHGTGIRALDAWVPIGMAPALGGDGARVLNDRSARGLMIGARKRPEVPLAAVAAEIDVIGQRLEPTSGEREPRLGLRVAPLAPIPGRAGPLVVVLALLGALVACVLVTACANVAGVLLARVAARRRELAVRLAIGSGRGRLVRQLITEAALLFACGGVTGLLVAFTTTRLLESWLATLPFPVVVSLRLDGRVLAFTASVSLAAALLSALAPALDASRADVLSGLRADAPRVGRLRLRHALVGAQVACSLGLVLGAGLFARALVRAATIDTGFDPRGVALATVDLGSGGLTPDTGPAFAREIITRVRALRGVEAASLAITVPGSLEVWRESLRVPSASVDEPVFVDWNVVEPGYFATLRIPIVAGRDFTDADRAGTQPTIVVSESAARRWWPGQSAIGQYLAQPRPVSGPPGAPPRMLLVVGVARDIQSTTLVDGVGGAAVYAPLQQHYVARLTVVARTRGALRFADDLRAIVAAMRPGLAIQDAQSLDDAIALAFTPQRLAASVAGGLGVVGLLLTGLGVHGVMAYAVTRRTREIGVRRALGARRADVVGMVLREALWLGLVGSAIGAGLAMAATFAIRAFLFGISPLDPVTLAGTAAAFTSCGIAACAMPVLRATRIQPTEALRDQ